MIEHEGYEHGFSIMVSIKDTGPGNQGKVPMYRWLLDDGTPAGPATEFGFYGGQYYDLKFPKVDALYDPDNERVIVAVSFMWRLLQEPPPNDVWNVDVIFLYWDVSQFESYPIPEHDGDFIHPGLVQRNQWGHDIAFNPRNAEAFLVFSTETSAPIGPYRLMYRVYSETILNNWSYIGPYYAASPSLIGNHWLPSVDVGLLNMHDPNDPQCPYPAWPIDFVGVAFTFKAPDQPYKVAFNYWAPSVDGYGHQTVNTDVLVNPYVDSSLNYGLPCLDIAPNNTVPHYYALTWVHETEEDHLYDVWLGDNFNNDMRRLADLGCPGRQRILPSVACHYSGLYGEKAVSVSVYEDPVEGDPSGSFQPAAVFYSISYDVMDDWHRVQAGYDAVYGPWNCFNVAYMDSGIATSIVLNLSNEYYIGFADSVTTTVNPPTTVYAAWGDTIP